MAERRKTVVSEKPYVLGADEKAVQVMVGTSDMLVWGDLVLKKQVQVAAFLVTLAEDFLPLHDVQLLFLASGEGTSPNRYERAFVKLEEILVFLPISETVPAPEESEVRHQVPAEMLAGPYRVTGKMLKSPVASLQNVLLVMRDAYLPLYEARVHHVAKPWLSAVSGSMVQVRRDRLTLVTP